MTRAATELDLVGSLLQSWTATAVESGGPRPRPRADLTRGDLVVDGQLVVERPGPEPGRAAPRLRRARAPPGAAQPRDRRALARELARLRRELEHSGTSSALSVEPARHPEPGDPSPAPPHRADACNSVSAMKISETITYAAPPETVYAMVTDRAFQERKCVEAGAQRHEASVSPPATAPASSTKRDLPADDLPDFAKSIVGSTLIGLRLGRGRCRRVPRGSLTVEVAGARSPCGDVRLAAAGTARDRHRRRPQGLDPALGGKVEKAAAPAVVDAIRSEERTGRRWLADRA